VTTTLHQPCTRFDLCEVVERATSGQMGMMMGQMAAGHSFALRGGFGVAVACGGYVEVEAGIWQAWFCVNRQTGPRAMLAIIRAIALTLEAGDYPLVNIEVETAFGRRIAKALGFERVTTGTSTPEVWSWQLLQQCSKSRKMVRP
jgi:hypothetical protein